VKILHVDSSILGENSCSRRIAAGVMAKLKKAHPDAILTYRDLAEDPVPHLSPAYMAASQGITFEHEPELLADLNMSERIMQEFLDADIIVLGVAFYNFSISSTLKAWIDRIIVLQKTFRYTADGSVEGLVSGKRVILAIARGGFYAEGMPNAAQEHCETYLKAILGFIGITDLDVIAADGIAVGAEHKAKALVMAEEAIARLPA